MPGILAGVFSAVATVGFLAWRKQQTLEAQGQALAYAISDDGSDLEALLLLKGTSVETSLRAMAEGRARLRAELTALQFLEREYGLSPERMAQLSQFATRWGLGGVHGVRYLR